ncbi:MAG: 50S ribosomal protein L14 [Candidatus Paceibacterota bacterium]|jgi:large subunit ribosomal protein L14|nr:50S ribosomal protein L14 [Candidatus Paceibacterota bacterium]MDD3548528.1 50S ribosomal protein L14 [Candidatus Paceibacterota bacterium]MDD4999071.1 50S ribosomal protein L14 [Candidatus Paceibacterota bacterium]MDD5545228.1 50S ribosomal protein L14 [Candidatus Paceibacterota bacterium]
MIQPRTILKVVDNSGAKIVRCFKVLGGSRKRYARIGDLIVASVQIAEPRREVKKKAVVKAIIVRQRKPFRRKDGSYIIFDENAVVLVNDKKEPLGNRIFGPLPKEIKEKGYQKVAALASELI